MTAPSTQDDEILIQALALKDDPVAFVAWAYPWGVKDTPFAGLTGPRQWQLEELEKVRAHLAANRFAADNELPLAIWRAAYSSGRGPGKSALLGMLAHWHISTHWGAMAVVVANTEGQLRGTTFPEFSKWFTSSTNSHWFQVEGMKISVQPWLAEQVQKHPSQGGLNLDPEKWVVKGKTWVQDNPNAYAGEHNDHGMMLLIDEAAGVAPFVWDLSEGFFTEVNPYRFEVAASQARHRSGRFFELFNDEKMRVGWNPRTISTRGMPGVDQSVVEQQILRYGPDSDFVRVEIDGLPPRTSDDQFISWESVRAAMSNDLFRDYGEPLILGVDPAPRGKSSWRFKQGRNARDCCGSSTGGSWIGKDNIQIAESILDLDRRFKPDFICIDFGLGTGVIDYLKRKRTHGRIVEVKFGDAPHGGKDSEWGSHAAELWARMRDWLPGGMIPQDNGEKGTLTHQLTDRGWRYSQREEGKKILETKEDMRKRGVDSPDDADALACTFEVNPPRIDQIKQRRNIIADGVDPSPFD